ncbi:hypothetical protein H4582DRAFT_2064112 [Lactarius indigo]|nr:hypothetical protein H4582DRAFT_2064112 [Lactarius indigo]
MPTLRYRRPPIAGDISALIDSIAVALSDLTIFNFVLLFEFNADLDASPHLPFALLWIFPSGRLDDLHARQHTHVDTEEHEHQSGPYYVQVATVLKASATQFERWVMIGTMVSFRRRRVPARQYNASKVNASKADASKAKKYASGKNPVDFGEENAEFLQSQIMSWVYITIGL